MKKLSILCYLILVFATRAFSQNADINLLRTINLHRNTNLDGFFRGVTNSAAPITYGLPLVMLGVGLIKKDSVLKRNALYTGASVIATLGITTVVKHFVNRDRPFITYAYIQKAASGESPSFPSGHTSNAFAAATTISLIYPKWYVIAPAYLWAGTVAYSRVDLGMHYPSDVLAGALIGAGTSFLCHKINQRLASRRK